MTRTERAMVRDDIESEGFDYALRHYDDYKSIEDPEFHKMLDAYREAAEAIEDYIG